jgi:hypothetical protein
VTDRLIKITTALAVVAVTVVAAAVHRGRADLGRVHGGAGRQPLLRLAAWRPAGPAWELRASAVRLRGNT